MHTKLRSKNAKRLWRHKRLRAKVSGTAERPRLSVFRSARHIYAQVIDDHAAHTLFSFNDKEIDRAESQASHKNKAGPQQNTSVRVKSAFSLGHRVAEQAKKDGITKVVFDRGGYAYHGLIKAVADGARDGLP